MTFDDITQEWKRQVADLSALTRRVFANPMAHYKVPPRAEKGNACLTGCARFTEVDFASRLGPTDIIRVKLDDLIFSFQQQLSPAIVEANPDACLIARQPIQHNHTLICPLELWVTVPETNR